jgi:hypothetical protein
MTTSEHDIRITDAGLAELKTTHSISNKILLILQRGQKDAVCT